MTFHHCAFPLSVRRHEWGQSVILFCWFKLKFDEKNVKHYNISLYVLHNTTGSKYNPIDHTQGKQGSVKSQRKLYFLVWVDYGVILTLTNTVWFLRFGLVWFGSLLLYHVISQLNGNQIGMNIIWRVMNSIKMAFCTNKYVSYHVFFCEDMQIWGI